MVGIVVVSHSRALGDAVAALAREMAGDSDTLSLAVAAGLDDTTFGTDAAAVAAAIEEVAADGNDVLVLVDIGSSVLSAEMACEFIDPDVAERVRISSAPLVEGIVPAVVAASTGASLEEVAAEAEEGLAAKQAHLDEPQSSAADFETPARSSRAPQPANGGTRPAESIDITVNDPHGLHARPAAKLVALVRTYDATVTLSDIATGAGPVPATSLSKVATLNAGHGARLRVTADGPQAAEVLAAVQDLASRDFTAAASDETQAVDQQPTAPAAPQGSGLDGALGPAHVLRDDVDLQDYQAGSPAEEQQRSEDAVAAVAGAIRRQQGSGTSETSDILGAHLVLLEDEAMLAEVATRIGHGDPAPDAWQEVLRALAADFEGLADAYQRARAQDVRAIERQVLRALVQGPESLEVQDDATPHGAVLVVDELDPSTASALDGSKVSGVVTIRGGSTGHGVIVARSRGIPIFTDGGEAAGSIESGQTVGFDAPTRLLVVDPDADQSARLRYLLDERRADAEEAEQLAGTPAVTEDGVRMRVGSNLTSEADAVAAAEHGAEGSGLLRTEILFGGAQSLPSSAEQAAAFVAIGRALHGEPVTIRTWDVGGDKPLPFLPGPQETNPMLGVRGLRLFRHTPEALDEQLVAVCEAAAETPVRVMFPMVSTRAEVDWALDRVAQARARTGAPPIPVGIMVEVPAAAIRIGELARGLDFVSIGTNDLTQYTLAADRGNADVSELADSLNPAVLQLIRQVVDGVTDEVEVGVCGDLASRVEAVTLLLGLGVDELSVIGPVIPRVKQAIRHTSTGAARELADRALRAPSAKGVREMLVQPR